MMRRILFTFVLAIVAPLGLAQMPANLVADGIPEIPEEVIASVQPYLEYRTATFADWHPTERRLLIRTRFGETSQIHRLDMPMGMRRQLTFFDEPVSSGVYRPTDGHLILFTRDVGGGEFHQIYSYDTRTGEVRLLTDGTSRNSAPLWSNDGEWIAFTSTRRNRRSNDLYVMKPHDPSTLKLLVEAEGGEYWGASDWSPDDRQLAVGRRVSANQSDLFVLDLESGELRMLSEQGEAEASWRSARFAHDGSALFATTDLGGEFHRLVRIDLDSGERRVFSGAIPWDAGDVQVQPGGPLVAVLTNEAGVGVLRLYDGRTGSEVRAPRLPSGVPSNIRWRPDGTELALQLETPTRPNDVYTVELESGRVERWTESETGGVDLPPDVEPELVWMKSFDGTDISAFVYRPDPQRFPGKRPVLVSIHGGPESQSRPRFLGAVNYYLDAMGMAVVYPNVRGSSGFGKTFLQMDDGRKREDSVRDIGAVLDWIERDEGLDSERIAVYGGSYGGYMVLASLVHYSERLKAAIDVVGISNFVTFLENTEAYRRDLRRVEYGDERDPEMRAFLEEISPLNHVDRMQAPLFVIQGLNDPRVPASESKQIVEAVRANGRPVWYLLATDEGHGFRKQKNREYQMYTIVMFLREHLLGSGEES
jgi:dipeptidyl aminopeptidase/acylaminoacyl peptidase